MNSRNSSMVLGFISEKSSALLYSCWHNIAEYNRFLVGISSDKSHLVAN